MPRTVKESEQQWEVAAAPIKRPRGRPAGTTKAPSTTQEPHIAADGKKTTKYLNNPDLLKAVIESKEAGKMSDTLARMLMLLVKRYGSKSNFANYTYNDEMQSFALLMLMRTWASFKETESRNPFAYYTQCVKNSFIQYMSVEKKHQRIRDSLMVEEGLLPSYSFQYEYADKYHRDPDDYDGRGTTSDYVPDKGASRRSSAVIHSQFESDNRDRDDEDFVQPEQAWTPPSSMADDFLNTTPDED